VLVDSLAKLNSSARNAISGALVVITAIGMYNWVVAPYVTYLRAAQQYEAVVGDIAKKDKIISSAVRVKKKKLEQLREQFAQLQSTLFTVEGAKQFFSDLQPVSEEVGCTVYSLNLVASKPIAQDEQSKDSVNIVTNSAMLSIIGAYSNIIKLVERLQARPQKVWIESVTMASLEDDSAQLKCDLTITICTIQDKEAILHE